MDCRNLANEGWWLLRALDDLGHRYMTHGYWLDQKSTLPCRSRPRPAPDYRPSKAGRGGILDLDARVWHGHSFGPRNRMEAQDGRNPNPVRTSFVGLSSASHLARQRSPVTRSPPVP